VTLSATNICPSCTPRRHDPFGRSGTPNGGHGVDFPEIVGGGAHAESDDRDTGHKGETMIDWDSETWGGGVTYAADGSWLGDKQSPGNTHRQSSSRDDD
jgi:hypothetical protein